LGSKAGCFFDGIVKNLKPALDSKRELDSDVSKKRHQALGGHRHFVGTVISQALAMG
jgi:hypothetical protein